MLKKENIEFTIEAATTSAAQGEEKEWERPLRTIKNLDTPEAIAKINKEAIIRISNTIMAKRKKYKEKYKNLKHVQGKPFVLAIGTFEQNYFYLQHDRAIRAVLFDEYIDEEAFRKHPEKFPKGPPSVKLGTIEKDNGSSIDLGFFNSDVMSEVSAIIFSCTATMGKVTALSTRYKIPGPEAFFDYMRYDKDKKPEMHTNIPRAQYNETLKDGLQIYHNPFAKYKLPIEIFRSEGVIQHYLDPVTNMLKTEGEETALIWRQVRRIHFTS